MRSSLESRRTRKKLTTSPFRSLYGLYGRRLSVEEYRPGPSEGLAVVMSPGKLGQQPAQMREFAAIPSEGYAASPLASEVARIAEIGFHSGTSSKFPA